AQNLKTENNGQGKFSSEDRTLPACSARHLAGRGILISRQGCRELQARMRALPNRSSARVLLELGIWSSLEVDVWDLKVSRTALAVHDRAAVRMQNLSRHVRRIVRRQEHITRRDFFRLAGPFHRNVAAE